MEANNPYAAPTSEVRDILPPGETLPLAGLGARLGAAILDGIVAALLVYLPVMLVVGPAALIDESGNLEYSSLVRGGGVGLIGLLLLIGITAYLVHKNGQTIGKRMVGIKVIRKDGSRATLSRILFVRNVPFWLVSLIPIVGPLVSLLDTLLIFRASRQCLHDQVADTIVVST